MQEKKILFAFSFGIPLTLSKKEVRVYNSSGAELFKIQVTDVKEFWIRSGLYTEGHGSHEVMVLLR
jgi:hypothetical protein